MVHLGLEAFKDIEEMPEQTVADKQMYTSETY